MEELQRFAQLLQQKVIELNKNNNAPKLLISDTNYDPTEKEQLIAQIGALTIRNESIETQLTESNTTISMLTHKIDNTISMLTHK